MLRSRLFTPAFKLFAALSAAAALAAFVSAVGSSDVGILDRILGPVTLGWKGSVGGHLPYTVFLSLVVVAGGLAGIHIAFRDADAEAEAEVAHTDTVPLTRAPSGTNFLPIMAAFALGVLVIGQLTSLAVTFAGFGLLAAVGGVWVLRAWAERATGDAEVNRQLYHRFIEPLRIPVLSVLVISVIVIGFSRVLLALSHTGAVAVFGAVAAVALLVIGFVAAKPSITKSALTILLFLGAVAFIAAGIIAAVIGEQEVDHEPDQARVACTQPAAGHFDVPACDQLTRAGEA